MNITTIGIDIAKNIFQVHGVCADGKVTVSRQLRSQQLLPCLRRLPPCTVGLEACPGAHYWARQIAALGHDVRLMPPQYVKPCVKRQKNDAADAEAICEAVTKPTMRFVAVKTEEQQAVLMLHRTRELLIRQKSIPGVGPITASVIVASFVDGKQFRNGRQFAAWLGLVRRQSSTGGKSRFGRITKWGDSYVRKLLVVSSCALIRYARDKSLSASWLANLLARRPAKLAAVAMANKTARNHLGRAQTGLLFRLISRLYERTSVIV